MLKKGTINKLFAFGVAGLMLVACKQEENHRGWQYMPDMYDGPALEAYSPTDLFSDSTSARKPVEGTIPRGFMSYEHYSADAAGYDSAKAHMKLPTGFVADEQTMAEAKELYTIFCAHCHGDKGDGQGVLVKREKFLGVPNYADHDINYGSIFHVITYGKGVMGSHASQVTPEERWKLALYVMELKEAMAPAKEEAPAEDAAAGDAAAEGESTES